MGVIIHAKSTFVIVQDKCKTNESERNLEVTIFYASSGAANKFQISSSNISIVSVVIKAALSFF